ncbi:MAG TPA: hypothetical protein VEK80_11830 [Kribbellaceae bacterium]|nr:hypothetical protein [Kribbellaceae bacterium]
MSLQLPPDLHWLSWVVGSDWPAGDEDALGRCAQAWSAAALEVRNLLPEAESAGLAALSTVDGDVAVALRTAWSRFTDHDDGYLEQLAKACDELARLCEVTALQVEYAKYQFIVALVALAITIVTLAAAAAGTFGASTAGIPVAEAATQTAVRAIAVRLVKSVIMGAAENAAMDITAQLMQMVNGRRQLTDWDWRQTATAAEDGAIFGAVGGLVRLSGGQWAPDHADRFGGHLLTGALTGGAGSGATALVHGEPLSGTDFLRSLTAGLVEGGTEHAPAGHADLFDLPSPARPAGTSPDPAEPTGDLKRARPPTR